MQPARHRLLVVFCAAALYGLILVCLWCARMVYQRPYGRFTSDQIRHRSEAVCRVFGAPGDPSDWVTDARTVYDGDQRRRRIWSVYCTDFPGTRGRVSGAFVQWDADTGELQMVSNTATDFGTSPPSRKSGLTADTAVDASYRWLKRLSLIQAHNPWILERSPEREGRTWQVHWRNRSHACLMQIIAQSGDMSILKIRSRPR
jgi:hypothetical protein